MVDHQPAPKILHRLNTTASSLDTISSPAVFFDRDGVLNVNLGFVYLPEDFHWIDGAIKTIKFFNNAKYLVFVVTNQSGVARGYYTEHDVQQLHKWMNAELAKQAAHIDAFYYCPHYPDAKLEQYRKICQCRKPMPGLIQQAIQEWPVKPTQSFLIGDMDTDLKAAATAGIKGYLFNEENLFNFSTRVGLIKQ